MKRLPRMFKVRQFFFRSPFLDLTVRLRKGLEEKGILRQITPGQRIALTVGSRNIAQLAQIVRLIVAEIRKLGASPLIIPAMGSHGGATSQGQLEVLNRLSIREAEVDAPFLSSMEVVDLGKTRTGIPLCTARAATEVDGILLLNRIKPHTAFGGQLGSGLIKMLTVGLGKKRGAEVFHRYGLRYGFVSVLSEMGRALLGSLPILGGVAIIEDYYHQIAQLEVLGSEQILESEPSLLERSRQLMGRLPFKEIDLLIVDEMGKDISGSGMDTNVIARGIDPLPPEPSIKRIVVRDLTEATHGNAFGVGLADFIPKRLLHKIDFNVTLVNLLTAGAPEKGKQPPVLASDREAIEAAIESLGQREPEEIKLVRIKNTLELEEIWVGEGLLPEVEAREALQIRGPLEEMKFDEEGNLL